MSEQQRELYRLPPEGYELARRRLKLLSLIQFTMPGIPCIYYGDEAGLQGYADPFNRAPYPWGREDEELLAHYRRITALRRQYPALSSGEYRPGAWGANVYGCRRSDGETVIQVLANRGTHDTEVVQLPAESPWATELLTGRRLEPSEDGRLTITLEPLSGAVILYGR